MNTRVPSKREKIDEEVAMLAFLRDNSTIIKSVVKREKVKIRKEAEEDQMKRYNDLCNAYPCKLRYFDEVPLCKEGKEGPCSTCELRPLIMNDAI